jgi:hypothetical protein
MICHSYLSLQTQCKRLNQDCIEVCSSLQQQAAAVSSTASAAAAAAAAAAALAATDSLSSSDVFHAMKQ